MKKLIKKAHGFAIASILFLSGCSKDFDKLKYLHETAISSGCVKYYYKVNHLPLERYNLCIDREVIK